MNAKQAKIDALISNEIAQIRKDIERVKILHREIAACKAAHVHLLPSMNPMNLRRIAEREQELDSLILLLEVYERFDVKEIITCNAMAALHSDHVHDFDCQCGECVEIGSPEYYGE